MALAGIIDLVCQPPSRSRPGLRTERRLFGRVNDRRRVRLAAAALALGIRGASFHKPALVLRPRPDWYTGSLSEAPQPLRQPELILDGIETEEQFLPHLLVR